VSDLMSVSYTNRHFGPESEDGHTISRFSVEAPTKLEGTFVCTRIQPSTSAQAPHPQQRRVSARKRKVKTTTSDKSGFILFTTDVTCGRLDPDDGKVLDGLTNVSFALKEGLVGDAEEEEFRQTVRLWGHCFRYVCAAVFEVFVSFNLTRYAGDRTDTKGRS